MFFQICAFVRSAKVTKVQVVAQDVVHDIVSLLTGELPSRIFKFSKDCTTFTREKSGQNDESVLIDMIQQFLDHHGFESVDHQDLYSVSPLHRACATKIDPDQAYLLDKSSPTRYFSDDANREQLVQYILHNGGTRQLMSKDMNGWTPLHHALNSVGLVRILVKEYHANVNTSDYRGQTALHIISRDDLWNEGTECTDVIEVLQMLLDHGADMEARDMEGWTPLLRACSEGNVAVVKFLAEHGANLKSRASEARTPLHLLLQPREGCPCKSDDIKDILELCVQGGADLNAQDKYGFTSLHQATLKGRGDIVRYLMQHGADASITANDHHMTALHLASHLGQYETFQVLLEFSPDLMAVTSSGDTVLHLATTAPMAQCILENTSFHSAADRARLLHTKNQLGQTPLDVVKQRLQEDAAESCRVTNSQLKEYLESYTECALAVPASKDDDMMEIDGYDYGVKLNGNLNDFQKQFANETLDLLNRTEAHAVSYMIMGYLSAADVMKR